MQVEYDPDWPPERVGRMAFTPADDMKIIRYLLATKDVVHLGGNEVWKRMEHSKKYNSRGFGWQSLKERWKKKIEPNLDRYGLNDAQWELIKCQPHGYRAIMNQNEPSPKRSRNSCTDIVLARKLPQSLGRRSMSTSRENVIPRNRRLYCDSSPAPLSVSIISPQEGHVEDLQKAIARKIINSARRNNGKESCSMIDDETFEGNRTSETKRNVDEVSLFESSQDERLPDLVSSPQSIKRRPVRFRKQRALRYDETSPGENPRSEEQDTSSDEDKLVIDERPPRTVVASQDILRAAVVDTQPEDMDLTLQTSRKPSSGPQKNSTSQQSLTSVQETQKDSSVADEIDELIFGVFAPPGEKSTQENSREKGEPTDAGNPCRQLFHDQIDDSSGDETNSEKNKDLLETIPVADLVEGVTVKCDTADDSQTLLVVVQSSHKLELPDPPGGDNSALGIRFIEFLSDFLRTHHNEKPHEDCIGFREFVRFWVELKTRIDTFLRSKKAEGDNELRQWAAHLVDEQVASILRLPVCSKRKTLKRTSVEGASEWFANDPKWVRFVNAVSRIRLS